MGYHSCTACNQEIFDMFHVCGHKNKRIDFEILSGQERRIIATFNPHD